MSSEQSPPPPSSSAPPRRGRPRSPAGPELWLKTLVLTNKSVRATAQAV